MCTNDPITVNLQEPRYDPDTYSGRVKCYFQRHNPFNLLIPSTRIEEARCLYLKYRCGEPLPPDIDEEELWRAKTLYESAYNRETGAKLPFLARPASHVPVNAVLAGGMMAYYKSVTGVIFWHWLNQTYNTFLEYTNKKKEITEKQLATSYVLATGTAVGTALGLNHLIMCSSPLLGRFVPLMAVAAAHCVRAPLMNAQVLKNGTPIYDDCNVKLGHSKRAAQEGVSGVIFSKIMNAVPPLVLTPLVMHCLELRGTLCRYPWINFPAHVGIAGLCLGFLSPLTCAIFAQKPLFPYKHLEPETQEYLCKKFSNHPPKYVYYDKNL